MGGSLLRSLGARCACASCVCVCVCARVRPSVRPSCNFFTLPSCVRAVFCFVLYLFCSVSEVANRAFYYNTETNIGTFDPPLKRRRTDESPALRSPEMSEPSQSHSPVDCDGGRGSRAKEDGKAAEKASSFSSDVSSPLQPASSRAPSPMAAAWRAKERRTRGKKRQSDTVPDISQSKRGPASGAGGSLHRHSRQRSNRSIGPLAACAGREPAPLRRQLL